MNLIGNLFVSSEVFEGLFSFLKSLSEQHVTRLKPDKFQSTLQSVTTSACVFPEDPTVTGRATKAGLSISTRDNNLGITK